MTNDELILSLRDWFASQSSSLANEDRLAVENALNDPNLRSGWLVLNELKSRLPASWEAQINDYYSAVF